MLAVGEQLDLLKVGRTFVFKVAKSVRSCLQLVLQVFDLFFVRFQKFIALRIGRGYQNSRGYRCRATTTMYYLILTR